ncbi:FKBP-type peptidyl-prolyl cis-trans isomerase [Lutibacter citreus]|uniref:FKBP-type peptidyl-prolyl cis-trans isomerase n=1 Tax=Lutibacter citreus TaxID=2138210 RepID=UPI000DBE9EE5|nr:FKBP-type peptidyl-prolyl cis-trans isomerase [Lutibacter citreus]
MKAFFSILLLAFVVSCNSSDDDILAPLGQTEDNIIEYLATNNINAERSDSGLYYIIEEEGEGDLVDIEALATISYTGYFLDGTVFDASGTSGYSFYINNLIKGFSEGITKFKKGGKGKLFIPPSLGYGNSGTSTIPGEAVLVFDIEVINVNNPQNEDNIIAYLNDNNLVAEKTNTGVYYITENEGDGESVLENSNVTINYKGYFLDGTEFENSPDGGATIELQNTIKGFSNGLSQFKLGGKGTILITPDLAYGENGISNLIPPNTVVIFDIEILSIN